MPTPKVSVIVITLNEEEALPEILGSLAAQTFRDFETIVVDSNSTDDTELVARRYGKRLRDFRFHRMQKRGIALGRNTGALLARGNLLFFMDADITIPSTFIAENAAAMEQRRLGVGGVYTRARSSNPFDQLFFIIWNVLCFITQWFYPHTLGACIVARRSVHKTIGGFDGSIRIGEDSEYALRASKQYRVRMLPTPINASARRFSTEGRFRMVWRYVQTFLSRVFFGEIRHDRIKYWFGHHKGERPTLTDGRRVAQGHSSSEPSRRRR